MNRVMAIGLDAAEWSYIAEHLDAGELPRLAALRARSAECRLTDSSAYRHGFTFEKFIYGAEPRLGAAWDLRQFDSGTYASTIDYAGKHADLIPFWERDPSLRTIAFDIPKMFLGTGPNSVEVVAWGADAPQHPRASRPRGLLREIDRTIGPNPSFDNCYECNWQDLGAAESMVSAMCKGAALRAQVVLKLMDRFPRWELFVTVMSETHSCNEHFFDGVESGHPLAGVPGRDRSAEYVLRVHKSIDKAIGTIVDSLPDDTTVVVFSPYGCETGSGDVPSIALLPELLHRLHGGKPNLRFTDPHEWRRSGFPPVIPAKGESWTNWMGANWLGPRVQPAKRSVTRSLLDNVSNPGLVLRLASSRLSRNYRGAAGVPIPAETRLTRQDIISRPAETLDWLVAAWYRQTWPQMRAFALPSFSNGLVRVNLAGRESQGRVAVEDYSAVLDEVELTLRACRNPRDGTAVVKDVVRYRWDWDPLDPAGPYADLGIDWAGPIDAFEHPELGFIGPLPFHRVGAHSPNGFMFASGPDITAGDLGSSPSLNLPATILALSGCQTEGIEGSPILTAVRR